MDSRASSDPFVRNRHRWAIALWLVTVGLNARDLTYGWRGIIGFFLTAVIWAVIAYMLGSHRDRDRADFWRPLVGIWFVILIVGIGWALALSVLDAAFDWRWIFPQLFIGLVSLLVLDAYRRTKAGEPWRRTAPARR